MYSFSSGYTLIFYTCFFAGLAVLFSICMKGMLATLSYQKPRWTLKDSLIGTNPGEHTSTHLSAHRHLLHSVFVKSRIFSQQHIFQTVLRTMHFRFLQTMGENSLEFLLEIPSEYYIFILKNRLFPAAGHKIPFGDFQISARYINTHIIKVLYINRVIS